MSMNNIPVLRVFDAQGKGIEIPAIKGEKGDLTSTVLLSAGSDSDDYTVRYSDGLQISFGYFAAVIQNTQQIAALGESKTIFCIRFNCRCLWKESFPAIFYQHRLYCCNIATAPGRLSA